MSDIANRNECLRVRDVGRRHAFPISVRDAEGIWRAVSQRRGQEWLPLPPSDEELLAEIQEELHAWAVDNAQEPAQPLPPIERPLLIDMADGPCPICQRWQANKYAPRASGKGYHFRCDECGNIIPDMDGMQGHGCEGTQPHHYHLRMVNNAVPGREGIFQELCPECFLEHRARVYPDRPLGAIIIDGRRVRRRSEVDADGSKPSSVPG